MRIKVVIMSHNLPENVDKLYSQLNGEFEVEVFDSGSDPDKIPKSITAIFENIYWTGLWNEMLKRYKDYDVLWALGGDIRLRSNSAEYREAIETAMPFGCWSPSIQGRCHDFMKAYYYTRKDGQIGKELVCVKNVEGMAMAVSGELAREVGQLVEGCKIGFGQDFWLCHRARSAGMLNKIDGRVRVYHPEEIGYDPDEAIKQMNETFEGLYGEDFRKEVFEYWEWYQCNLWFKWHL